MKFLSLATVATGIFAADAVLVKKSKKQTPGRKILRGNSNDASSGSACAPEDAAKHSDGLMISVRCCKYDKENKIIPLKADMNGDGDTDDAEDTVDVAVDTVEKEDSITQNKYGGKAPGVSCNGANGSPDLREFNFADSKKMCEVDLNAIAISDQTAVNADEGEYLALCNTVEDVTTTKSTGCDIDNDWVWSMETCEV